MEGICTPDHVREILDHKAPHRRELYDACLAGDTETAKRILTDHDLTESDLGAFNNSAFKFACVGGHLETAQWIAEKCKLTRATPCVREAMLTASGIGHLPMARWLATHYDLWPRDARAEKCLSVACMSGHLDMAKWLARHYQITRDDIVKDGEGFAIFAACHSGDLNTIKWLVTHYSITMEDLCQVPAVGGKTPYKTATEHADIREWLKKHFES